MALSTKRIAGEEAVHYVPARKKRPKGARKMQPPLTPMIDVTFQLLLFFMLTFTIRAQEGLIPGTLPAGDMGGGPPPQDPIFINVKPSPGDPTGAVYELKGESIQIREPDKLYALLLSKREEAGSTKVPVIIGPDGYVLWQHVVEAFNQAVRAKFQKIGFASSSGGT